MGRRRKVTINKKYHRKPFKKDKRGSRKRMLDMGKLNTFRYELKKVLVDVEGGKPLFANIFSKTSNIGIDETKKYIYSVLEKEDIEEDKAAEIIDLLNRFSKFR